MHILKYILSGIDGGGGSVPWVMAAVENARRFIIRANFLADLCKPDKAA